MEQQVLLILSITAIVLYFLYRIISLIEMKNKSRIPGPLSLPIIGTKWKYVNMSKLHEYYEELNRKYGNVVMEVSGNVPIISLYNRDDIEKVLSFPSQFPFRPPNEIQSLYRQRNPQRYSSTGISNEQGPEWRKLRMKLSLKTFENRKFYDQYCRDLNDICGDLVELIKSKRNEHNVYENFHKLIRIFSFETNFFFIFGRDGYEYLESKEMILKLTDANFRMFESIRDSYYGTKLWKYFPTKVYKKFAESEEFIYNTISAILNKVIKDGEFKASDTEDMSVFEKIMRTDGLDVKDKICGIIDFLAGSNEAKSATILHLFHHISTHPNVQEKIFKEASTLNDFLTLEDVKKAQYTKAVIFESFRLSPTAFAIARILEQDFEFSGHHLSAGTVVLCHNMIACRKEQNFEDARAFKPERWINENGEFDGTKYTEASIVAPFGVGKRICPGREFTQVEITLLVIILLRAFKLEYKSEFEEIFQFIVTPKFPVHMSFEDR